MPIEIFFIRINIYIEYMLSAHFYEGEGKVRMKRFPLVMVLIVLLVCSFSCIKAGTYITWQDNRGNADPTKLGGDWEIYSTELDSMCENPEENKPDQTSEFWAVWPPTVWSHAEIIVLSTSSPGATVTISFDPALSIPTQYGTASISAPYILILNPWASQLKSITGSGVVKNNAIHITATGPPVTVLFRTPSEGVSEWADTDVYQVLPTNMLGREYYSLSYTPLGMDSWYVAIATKDNTQVTYQPDPSSSATLSVTLNQWDTLTCASNQNSQDMTGCHVYTGSTTPISFVSGAYADIPQTAYAADTIMEMLQPVERWGSDYSTVPLAKNTPLTGDIIRVQASTVGTTVVVNGVPQTGTIGAGQYYELDTSESLHITSNNPVQVEQYAKSKYQYQYGPPLAGIGDPFEMTIIPTEQFSSRYTFYSPTWTSGPSEGAYVTIVAPNTATAAYLDGNPVVWVYSYYIGNFATILVTEGEQHYVSADGPIGVYSYGYEDVGAYGYPAGPMVILLHDIAIVNLAPSKNVIGKGYSIANNVTVINLGRSDETSNVTLYANQTIIGTLTNVTLPCGNCTTITFTWNTTGFAYGDYIIKAYAWPVPNETEATDNTLVDGIVFVTIPGDSSGDGLVDISDFAILGYYWFNVRGYDPRTDFNNDNLIDISDFAILGYYWFQHT